MQTHLSCNSMDTGLGKDFFELKASEKLIYILLGNFCRTYDYMFA